MRTLPKAYLRVDPNLAFTHPDPGSFVRLLCLANAQPVRGRFKEWGLLEVGLGAEAAQRLKARGDIVEVDGRWYVAGWDEWQEGDVTVAERQKRIRERRDSTVTPPLLEREPVVDRRNEDVRALGREDVCPPDKPEVDPVVQVFDHWRKAMGHADAKLTPDRRTKIESRLREKYTREQLCEAIDGCRASAFHMGANDAGTRHDDLTLILRNGGNVERFRRMRPKPAKPKPKRCARCESAPPAEGAEMCAPCESANAAFMAGRKAGIGAVGA